MCEYSEILWGYFKVKEFWAVGWFEILHFCVFFFFFFPSVWIFCKYSEMILKLFKAKAFWPVFSGSKLYLFVFIIKMRKGKKKFRHDLRKKSAFLLIRSELEMLMKMVLGEKIHCLLLFRFSHTDLPQCHFSFFFFKVVKCEASHNLKDNVSKLRRSVSSSLCNFVCRVGHMDSVWLWPGSCHPVEEMGIAQGRL